MILDEECRFPKGTDFTFLEKLHTNLATNVSYTAPKLSKNTFIVKHYAGDVSYTVESFLDKNRDTVQDDLLDMLLATQNKFVYALAYEEKKESTEASTAKTGGKDNKKKTLASKFKEQLNTLMVTLGATNPHYVRCIKPNTKKSPSMWDKNLVLLQLRYAGMMETIKIRQMGYPSRMDFGEFVSRYKCLGKLGGSSLRDQVVSVIKVAQISSAKYQLGKTKIFMKDGQRDNL